MSVNTHFQDYNLKDALKSPHNMSKKGKQRCTEVKTEDRNKYIPALDSIEAAISRGNERTTAEQHSSPVQLGQRTAYEKVAKSSQQ
ncbi:hypothetical protein SAY87_000148 [Trapa incisa]|uniref:Uncharacterized protein n=1 Tax=Trapa incisa TaxID=236973 RepID=A0AAN7JGE5_9MYRT|nr:hypothetical protein SAY87_000148 [Trapa incisa]